jgi:crotonobetainyl-CoA hydratase
MSEPNAVLTAREDHVLVITINRPEARNAVNLAVHMGVGQALEAAEADPEIRAVIVTGAGDRAFCAGADLKAIARGEKILPDDGPESRWGFCGFVRHPISKPVIAAVNGFALGGGTEITLASDIALAADTAVFGLPEVKRGIFAGAGGCFRLLEQIPRKIALEILFTGDELPAPRALELGLINAVLPRAALMDAALALARKIAANAPLSVQATKRIALGVADGNIASEETSWARSSAEGAKLLLSEDAKEGPRAFAEKRAPAWKGR